MTFFIPYGEGVTDGRLWDCLHERGHFLFLVWAGFSLYIILLEAAECLFISQSCLSKHIKKLETEIGVELFERTTRTVVLTEFGQMLLPNARKMVGLEYEFEKNVRRKIHQDSGNIVLGSIPSMKQHAITALIAGFLNENLHL